MKILVLIHEFPPVGGGGGRVARDIALGLAARGHEIRLLTAHIDGLSLSEDLVVGTGNHVYVERIPTNRKNAFQADLREMAQYNLAAVAAGRRIIRDWRPDIIHAHFAVPAGAAAFVLSKMTGIPYVLTAHLGDVPGAVPEKTDHWFKWIYPFTPPIWRSAARVVAVSEFTRNLALRHYKIPIDVIPNGVELAALPAPEQRQAAALSPLNIDQSLSAPIRIVFAGRFMEQKNPLHLVRALSKLRNLPWQCAMLGDGPLLETIRAQVAESGLADRIKLPGWVTPEQVLAEFTHSDLLVLPSRSEGLSVVGVQALAMGLALIMSAAGGNLELVNSGENGFLFPVGDVDMLTAQIRKLIENPSMLQSAQARSREMAYKYDLPAIVSQYENIFSSLVTKTIPEAQQP